MNCTMSKHYILGKLHKIIASPDHGVWKSPYRHIMICRIFFYSGFWEFFLKLLLRDMATAFWRASKVLRDMADRNRDSDMPDYFLFWDSRPWAGDRDMADRNWDSDMPDFFWIPGPEPQIVIWRIVIETMICRIIFYFFGFWRILRNGDMPDFTFYFPRFRSKCYMPGSGFLFFSGFWQL